MTRLEKAREARLKTRKQSKLFIIVIGFIVIACLAAYLLQDILWTESSDPAADLIDLERTSAFIDIFELTYVWVYLAEEAAVSEITADGEQLSFNDERGRWEIVLSGYDAGDEVLVRAIAEGERPAVLELKLILEYL